MNLHFKRTICLICALVLFSGTFIAFAAKKEPLYEKYDMNENYEYSRLETISNALESTVPMIVYKFKAKVTYQPVIFDSDTYMEDLVRKYEALLEAYSEDEADAIMYQYMNDNIGNYIRYGSRKTADSEAVATGSGVVIGENGYIATNAHVVEMTEKEKNDCYISALNEGVIEDLEELLEKLAEYGVELDEEEINELHYSLLAETAEGAEVANEQGKIFVGFPTASGDTSFENGNFYEAELEAIGTQDDIEGFTQDVAILKIDAVNLVALRLSESYPEKGSEIFSAGFPGASTELFESYGSTAASLSATIDSGKVSNIIALNNTEYKPIQISNIISHGSSGGPSVDSCLRVEGLNTYSNGTDERMAYMVPAAFVAHKAEEFELEYSDVSKTFFAGLQMLDQGYGAEAKECFEYVKKKNPDIPYIEKLILLAEKAPENEYKKSEAAAEESGTDEESGLAGFFEENKIILIAAAMGIVAAVAVFLICKVLKSKKKGNTDAVYYVPPAEPEPAVAPEEKPVEEPVSEASVAPNDETPGVRTTITQKKTSPPPSENSFFRRPDDL